jgi:hypothetical protein
VEVAARLNTAVRQDERIVNRRAQLGIGDPGRELNRLARRAEHLRSTTERVRVLHTIVAVAVARDDRRAGKQAAHVRRARRLAGLRAQRDEVPGEGPIGAEQRLHRHGGGNVRELERRAHVLHCQDEHREHPVGAVDERKPLLRAELEWLQTGSRERRRARRRLAAGSEHLPLAEQHERTVG